MPSHRGHQKKLEKKKKQRLAHRTARRAESTPASLNGLLRLAAESPFGTAFMSPSWRSEEPRLVTVVVTRLLADGTIIAGTCLLDRTCLGVKNAFARHLTSLSELQHFVDEVGDAHDEDMEAVAVLEAQSVVFHAIDYAGTLGFRPNRDFAEGVFGPRPERLLETPLARPTQPVYIPGPDDDVARIMRTLEASGVVPALV